MDRALQLHPGQQTLTPDQEAEKKRFVESYLSAQLSTEPVNEPEAEAFLRRAYEAAGCASPPSIHWLDGPRQLVALLTRNSAKLRLEDSLRDSIPTSMWDSLRDFPDLNYQSGIRLDFVDYQIRQTANTAFELLQASEPGLVGASNDILNQVWSPIRENVWWNRF